ncbi:PEGA domain-containing protein [Thermococcus gammatolerans]|nr:PEGA domain-containing protein [Thermococcus gammatolerans]
MKRLIAVVWIALLLGFLVVTLKMAKAEDAKWWAKTYRGKAYAIAVAPNGDVIVTGYTYSFGAGKSDVWVLRLEKNGNVKWQKTYGGSDLDKATAVAVALNGDIIIAGSTESFGAGRRDIWVLRLDGEGDVKWQKTYGGRIYDDAHAVAVAPNGDIIVLGSTESFGAPYHSDVWILRLDANGNVKWQKTYGGSDYDWAYAVAIAPNGDIIAAGGTERFAAGIVDVWILRLDENGNVKWQKTYGGNSYDKATAVAVVENEDIIVAGYYGATDFQGAGADVWILRLDENGNVKWQTTYGGHYRDNAYAIAVTPNEDLIVAGCTESFGTGNYDAWILRLDSKGNVKWQKTYGGSDDDSAHRVVVAPNGDIIVLGSTESFGTGYYDTWILRLPSDGNLPKCDFCGDSNAKISVPDIKVGNFSVTIMNTNATVQTTNVYPHSSEDIGVETQYISVGTISVTTNPSGAKVYVNGTYIGATPLTTNLSVGTYEITLKMKNYKNYTTTVAINPNEEVELNVILTPLPAHLTLNSTPSGVEIYVNGTYRGETPVTLKLSPGTYTVKFIKDEYENYTMSVTLSAGEAKNISVTLNLAYGYLSIESSPSKAEVYVDDNYIGKTPIDQYKLSTGVHEVKVEKSNYNSLTKMVTLNSSEKTKLNVILTPLPAHLMVNSNPSGAVVYINGTYKGKTPLTSELEPNTYNLRVSKEGYANYTTTVIINPGENKTINVELEPMIAHIEVSSDPAGAKVYVNGTYKGTTPLTLELGSGSYKVRATKEGYEDYVITVELKAGESKEITAQLKEKSTTTTTTTTVATSTSAGETTTTATSNGSGTTKTTSPKEGGGICGPALVIALALVPILHRKRKHR